MTDKLVNLYTTFPIYINKNVIRGNCYNLKLGVNTIRECLIAKAIIEEILGPGKTIRLTLENYNKDNSKVNEDKPVPPKVNTPKVEEKVIEPEPVEEPKVEEKSFTIQNIINPEPVEEPVVKEPVEEKVINPEPVEELKTDSDAELIAKIEAEEKSKQEVKVEQKLDFDEIRNKKKHHKNNR